jgi:ribosomal protein S27AE
VAEAGGKAVECGVECGKCGLVLDERSDIPMEKRQPCPRCGSTSRTVDGAATLEAAVSTSVRGEVERALNDIRLAVLGILVGIALTVGFGVPGNWWVQVLAGVAAFAAAAFLIWWRPARKRLMAFMHRITGH